jgi:hypothetical protein
MIIVCCNRHYSAAKNRMKSEKKTRIKLIFLRYWLFGFLLLGCFVALVNELCADRFVSSLVGRKRTRRVSPITSTNRTSEYEEKFSSRKHSVQDELNIY